MKKRLYASSLFMLLVGAVHAQLTFASAIAPQPYLPNSPVLPVNESSVTYNHVMFDHPPVANAFTYELTVSIVSPSSMSHSRSVTDSSASTLVTGLQFGEKYQWLYTAKNKKGKVVFTSPVYTFTILPLPKENRVRVITNDAPNYENGLISFDHHGLIVDRSGNPVWFMPGDQKREFRDNRTFDLRITPAGTITYLNRRNAFEVFPDARIAWQAPNSGLNMMGALHHAIERLPNGNLMTLGTHMVLTPIPGQNTSVNVNYGVIVEYDRTGKIVWKWDASTYLVSSDLEFKQHQDGAWTYSMGLNAFTQVNEGGQWFVYAGFRDLDRVVCIEKATGKVVASYGRPMPSGEAWTGHGFFHAQHGVALLSDGNIAVVSNDLAKQEIVSSVVVFSPAKKEGGPKLVWSFASNFDALASGKNERGGGVEELPDKHLLVNFGSAGRCMELTRDGKIVWDAFAETISTQDTTMWVPAAQNSSHYAASLYPVWFSCAAISSSKKMYTLKIWNEGIAADTYTIQYLSGNNWLTISTVEVAARRTTVAMVPKLKERPFTKIKVISATNPDFFRVIAVQ